MAFDIKLLNNNVQVQPTGRVRIIMPIPSGFNADNVLLYYVTADGAKTLLSFTLDSSKEHLIFETNHFSWYVLADDTAVQPELILMGDVNFDGKIDLKDLLAEINHIFATKPLTEKALFAADVNGDGKVDLKDLLATVDFIFGKAETRKPYPVI